MESQIEQGEASDFTNSFGTAEDKSTTDELNPFVKEGSRFEVIVTDSQLRKKSEEGTERWTVYKVVVTTDDTQKVFWKRYNQFFFLHQLLQERFPHVDLPTFPSKTYLSDKFDEEIVSQRVTDLDRYMKEISSVPALFQTFEVQLFLEQFNVSGKVCIITGASSGIGKVTAFYMALAGAHTILACRSKEKADPLIEQIKQETGNEQVEFMHLDLSSFSSVRSFAAEFNQRNLPLNFLINNAAIGGHTGLTTDGFETTIGVNHLGHFLLTNLLLENLKASAPSRIITVSSDAHNGVEELNFATFKEPTTAFNSTEMYKQSKLCNILFSNYLASMLEGTGVTSNAVHPGLVASELWGKISYFSFLSKFVDPFVKLFMKSEEEGALTTLYCALSRNVEKQTGKYYSNMREATPSYLVHDKDLQKKLWEESRMFVGL